MGVSTTIGSGNSSLGRSDSAESTGSDSGDTLFAGSGSLLNVLNCQLATCEYDEIEEWAYQGS